MSKSSLKKLPSKNPESHQYDRSLISFVKIMGFIPKENTSGVYEKKYPHHRGYSLEVDFENERFHYGSPINFENGCVLNFLPSENWVVFECVDRLLSKGYPPSNITLEKDPAHRSRQQRQS